MLVLFIPVTSIYYPLGPLPFGGSLETSHYRALLILGDQSSLRTWMNNLASIIFCSNISSGYLLAPPWPPIQLSALIILMGDVGPKETDCQKGFLHQVMGHAGGVLEELDI